MHQKVKKVAYIFVVILVAVTGHFSFKKNLLSISSFEGSPETYEFLLFPKSDAQIYAEKTFATPIGKLERAIGSTGKEINEKIVGVNLDGGGIGYATLASLAYLPQSNEKELVRKWQDFLAQEDIEGAWQTSPKGNGIPLVQLTKEDDKHARSFIYSYKTDGNHLVEVLPYKIKSGLVWAAEFIFFCIFFVVVLIIGKSFIWEKPAY